MVPIGELISVLAFRNVGKQTALIHEFLSGLTIVLGLTIISGMLVGALLVGSLYAFYHVLVSYGLETNAALWITAGIALLLTLLVVTLTISHLRRIMLLPKQIFETQAPIATRAQNIVTSFMDGLKSGAESTSTDKEAS